MRHCENVLPIPRFSRLPSLPLLHNFSRNLYAAAHSSTHSGRSGKGFVGTSRGLELGMVSGGGTISKGSGVSGTPGTGISNGAGIVIWAGINDASAGPLPAGENSPPIPSGLPAGQRGCLSGSQFALSIPLAWSWSARSTMSGAEHFDRSGGSGIRRNNIVICARARSPCSSACAAAERPAILGPNSTGRPNRLLRSMFRSLRRPRKVHPIRACSFARISVSSARAACPFFCALCARQSKLLT